MSTRRCPRQSATAATDRRHTPACRLEAGKPRDDQLSARQRQLQERQQVLQQQVARRRPDRDAALSTLRAAFGAGPKARRAMRIMVNDIRKAR